MISQSTLIEKLLSHCRQTRPTEANLVACCQALLDNFKFDCVFLAKASAPEEELASLAFSGKVEVMETCLYRLGVEERMALSKLPFKTYSDMTGKPLFNKSGSLRIQKPNSGVFMVLHRPKNLFLLLGCAHQVSQAYDPKLLEDLRDLWKNWSEPLEKMIGHLPAAGSPQEGPGGPSLSKQEKASNPPLPEAPAHPAAAKGEGKRPLVLVDEVTRLFNRDYFDECIAIEVERAKRYSRNMSVIFLSVMPNGSGAMPGDNSVATQVAEILSKSLRKVDFICRLEKSKYGIILPDTADNTYGVIAKRIFKFFKLVMGEAPPVYLNISASTYPKHATDHHSLLDSAEKLLRQAQEAGPNKAVLPE